MFGRKISELQSLQEQGQNSIVGNDNMRIPISGRIR